MEETYSRAGGREAAVGTIQGGEKTREESVAAGFGQNAAICVPQEVEMVSGLRKESQGDRQTDRQPGLLRAWDSAKMGGVCMVQ